MKNGEHLTKLQCIWGFRHRTINFLPSYSLDTSTFFVGQMKGVAFFSSKGWRNWDCIFSNEKLSGKIIIWACHSKSLHRKLGEKHSLEISLCLLQSIQAWLSRYIDTFTFLSFSWAKLSIISPLKFPEKSKYRSLIWDIDLKYKDTRELDMASISLEIIWSSKIIWCRFLL